MQHCYLAGEAGGEALNRLEGERDFGDEDYCLLAHLDAAVHGVEIDFCLSAAGYAFYEEGSVLL